MCAAIASHLMEANVGDGSKPLFRLVKSQPAPDSSAPHGT